MGDEMGEESKSNEKGEVSSLFLFFIIVDARM